MFIDPLATYITVELELLQENAFHLGLASALTVKAMLKRQIATEDKSYGV